MTGSHQRTCVFGALCIDGRQFFRQYSVFNQETFLKYLKELRRKFGKIILFIDRARQHHRSIMVRRYIKQSKGVMKEYIFQKVHLNLMLSKNVGDRGNMICWYQNTIRNLKISDMLLQTTIEQDVSN